MLRAALFALTLSGGAVAAPDDPDCGPQQRLEASQSCRVQVDATRAEVALPLALEAGDRYRVTVEVGPRWSDGGRDAVDPLIGDNGAGNCWMTLFKPFKRLRHEPYMVPVMAVADCDTFNRVCLRRETRLGPAGLLLAVNGHAVRVVFFANDVPGLNANNGGAVWISVQRLPHAATDGQLAYLTLQP